jgi:energy-dependent translational throttle protein EttA
VTPPWAGTSPGWSKARAHPRDGCYTAAAMAHQYIYTMQNLRRVHPPNKEVLKGIYLSFYPGAKIGVLGSNGAGKSTLLRIMAGVDKDFFGDAKAADGIRIGYLPQEPTLDPKKNVLENVEEAVATTKTLLKRFDEVNLKLGEDMSPAEMDKLLEEQGKLQDAIEAANGWDLDRTLEIAMDALRLPPADAEVTKLSGGERRRVALCRVLLERPDLLLIDEPTNHLDAESVAWLEHHLHDYPGTIVAVTHDRYFLDNVAGWILELDRGAGIPWEGNYSSWLEQKGKRLESEEKTESARQRTLARELEWVRASPRARQAKSKARLAAYEELLAEEQQKREDTIEISIPPGPRLGDVVVKAEHLRKAYGDKVLIEDLNFNLPRGGIVGIIGANGAGKTTLFRMITGQEKPDGGTLRIGETVKLAYVDQSRDTLDGAKTAFDEIAQGAEFLEIGKRKVPARAYVAGFNFKGTDQQKLVKNLSGGERNRVHLAKVLRSGGNVLLLDEPTNDLDVDTLRALEDGLLSFAGCAVVISHDRWFLDRVATHILAFEGNSQVVWFEGNYQDYEADRHRRLGAAADQPHRIHYKKLIH